MQIRVNLNFERIKSSAEKFSFFGTMRKPSGFYTGERLIRLGRTESAAGECNLN